ncbi:MAG: PspC domain-containing protein [Flavobacteriales bacterium]|nr:PspC domain-containing protein [Flavobacteriales bacterium]
MNQTVTVNISGIVFHIEVDAYEELKKYLNKIKSYFKNSEECNEIMTDIEARIAELFNEKISSDSQVIQSQDVEEVITIMGKPEQYVDEDEDEPQPQESFSSKQRTYSTAKKLFRDPDDRMIGGVASGIAAYFGIETIWLRLFFVVALFVGFGFLLYIILWIVMPEAKTASDKLQMKGDPVNIDNISKTFKQEADRVSENLKKNGQQYGKKAETAFEAFFSFLFQIFKGIFKVLGKIVGVVFLIVGTFWLVGLVGMLVGSETIFSITPDGIFSFEATEFFNLIFISENQYYMAIVGITITIGLPIIMLIYAGVKLLFKVKTHSGIGIGLFILWVIGIFMCAMVGIRMGTELTHDETVTSVEVISDEIDDFYISASIEENPGKGVLEEKYSIISLDEDSIYMNDIRLYIYKSKTDSMELKVLKSSNGKSRKDASTNAKMISYSYSVNDSSIFLGNYLATIKENKIRGQEVRVKLYLPVGKSIYLDRSLKRIIHNVDNVTDTWDSDMLEQKWVMLEDGLTCLDCSEIDGVTATQLDSIRIFEPIIEEVE